MKKYDREYWRRFDVIYAEYQKTGFNQRIWSLLVKLDSQCERLPRKGILEKLHIKEPQIDKCEYYKLVYGVS